MVSLWLTRIILKQARQSVKLILKQDNILNWFRQSIEPVLNRDKVFNLFLRDCVLFLLTFLLLSKQAMQLLH
jgi:hypothetical protein